MEQRHVNSFDEQKNEKISQKISDSDEIKLKSGLWSSKNFMKKLLLTLFRIAEEQKGPLPVFPL